MIKKIYYYNYILKDILHLLCDRVESYFELAIIINDKTGENIYPPKSEKRIKSSRDFKLKWEKTFEIQEMHFCIIIYVGNFHEFKAKMGKSLYIQEKFPVLNMFMIRLVDDLKEIIINDILAKSTTTNYNKDKEILLSQSVNDFFYDIGINSINYITYISSLEYEKKSCSGKIVFEKNLNDNDYSNFIRFEKPIDFSKANDRIVRKLLELCGDNGYLLIDASLTKVVGVLYEANENENLHDKFILEFLGHLHWRLRYNKMIAVEFMHGNYYITDDLNPQNNFKAILESKFPNIGKDEIKKATKLISIAQKQTKGTMLVISENAFQEANRLCSKNRGIKVEPFYILEENVDKLLSISSIDGAIMLDKDFMCQAIGVILDGPACDGEISRGARYNSALTYIKWKHQLNAWAIVVSEDGMVSIIS